MGTRHIDGTIPHLRLVKETPCHGCDARTPKCHGECPMYIAYQERMKERKQELSTLKKDFALGFTARKTEIERNKLGQR